MKKSKKIKKKYRNLSKKKIGGTNKEDDSEYKKQKFLDDEDKKNLKDLEEIKKKIEDYEKKLSKNFLEYQNKILVEINKGLDISSKLNSDILKKDYSLELKKKKFMFI